MPTMTMPNKLYQQLEKAAQMLGMSKDIVLENALNRYLAELQEDAEDTERAEKRGMTLKTAERLQYLPKLYIKRLDYN